MLVINGINQAIIHVMFSVKYQYVVGTYGVVLSDGVEEKQDYKKGCTMFIPFYTHSGCIPLPLTASCIQLLLSPLLPLLSLVASLHQPLFFGFGRNSTYSEVPPESKSSSLISQQPHIAANIPKKQREILTHSCLWCIHSLTTYNKPP